MTEETPLEGTLTASTGDSHPTTPEAATKPHTGSVVRRYLLTRREQKVEVLQYDNDTEVTQTIDYFLNLCRDMGWAIKILGE